MSDDAAVLGLEPDDLDGHSLDELSDYLDRGRLPADLSIDDSPACQIALGALQRLRAVAGALLDDPGVTAPSTDQDWISAALAAIPIDARAGRSLPWPTADPAVDAATTEGAVRGLVRTIGDDVPGLLVGSVRIGTDDPATLEIDVALLHGARLAPAVDALRTALRLALPEHLPLAVGAIDLVVVALIEPARAPGPQEGAA